MSEDTSATETQTPSENSSPVNTPSLGLLSTTDESKPGLAPTNDDSWKNAFSVENRAKAYLKEFSSADAFIKSYENQRSLIGKRLEDFTPEQLETYRTKLNVPSSPDAYKLMLSEDISTEGLDESWFRKTMSDVNIPQKDAQALYGKYAELINTQRETIARERDAKLQAGQAELDKVYGTAKPARMQGIVNFLREQGGEDVLSELSNSDLSMSPKFIQFLGKMAELSAEDRGVALSSSKSWGTTPSEAKITIENMRRDPEFLTKMGNDKQFKEQWMQAHMLAEPK